MDYKEKVREINEKFDKMDEKIHDAQQRKVLETSKHRELEQLRLSDIHQNLKKNAGSKIREKCEIVEKHIGMSLALQEKK